MKKSLSVIALMLAAVMMMCCLTACGDKFPAGTYNLVDVSGEGADSLRPYMDQFVLEVSEDGSAAITMGSYTLHYQFDKSSDKVEIEGVEATYSVSGKKVSIVNENGFTQVFERQ